MSWVFAWLLLNAAVLVVRVVVTSEWFRSGTFSLGISDRRTDRLRRWVVR
jgi:hypothetical protein